MRAILIALVLAAAPAALDAQYHPVPGDTARTLPELEPPSLLPQSTGSRGGEALAGAAEGALAGAVYGGVLSHSAPGCALAATARGSAVAGAAVGALWGGMRGLLGLRRRRAPVVTDVPDRGRLPAPSLPPVAASGCRSGAPRTGSAPPLPGSAPP